MWFNGDSIQQALNRSKNEKIMLLTFIKGSNDESVKLNNILDKTGFKDELNDTLVALKFEENSDNAKMFNAIYPIQSVPTITMVSSDGHILNQLNGPIDKAELINKINSALDQQKKLKSSDLLKNATTTNQSNASQSDSQKNKSTSPSLTNQSLKRANDESPVKDAKDKEQHALELIKEIRAKKSKEDEERARVQEKDRIRTGKEIQTAKEKQQQKDMEDAIKQREREKAEEKVARDRVLAQIKQDQEDRKARFGQGEVKAVKPLVISTPTQLNSDQTRIQFRLPDSSTMKNVFQISDSLRTVMKYIEDNTPYRSFKLATNFPKNEYGENDLDKTLVDLKLAPSAVLIVKKQSEFQHNAQFNN